MEISVPYLDVATTFVVVAAVLRASWFAMNFARVQTQIPNLRVLLYFVLFELCQAVSVQLESVCNIRGDFIPPNMNASGRETPVISTDWNLGSHKFLITNGNFIKTMRITANIQTIYQTQNWLFAHAGSKLRHVRVLNVKISSYNKKYFGSFPPIEVVSLLLFQTCTFIIRDLWLYYSNHNTLWRPLNFEQITYIKHTFVFNVDYYYYEPQLNLVSIAIALYILLHLLWQNIVKQKVEI